MKTEIHSWKRNRLTKKSVLFSLLVLTLVVSFAVRTPAMADTWDYGSYANLHSVVVDASISGDPGVSLGSTIISVIGQNSLPSNQDVKNWTLAVLKEKIETSPPVAVEAEKTCYACWEDRNKFDVYAHLVYWGTNNFSPQLDHPVMLITMTARRHVVTSLEDRGIKEFHLQPMLVSLSDNHDEWENEIKKGIAIAARGLVDNINKANQHK